MEAKPYPRSRSRFSFGLYSPEVERVDPNALGSDGPQTSALRSVRSTFHRIVPARSRLRSGHYGFTLVELMVAALIGGLVLTGVVGTNLQLLRSGTRATQYAEMSTQVRRGLQQLEGDLKSAITITWNSASDITLTLPAQNGTTSQITYAWTSATQSFFRVPGASSAVTAGRIYLVNGIPPLSDGSAGVAFARFDRDGNVATTTAATKLVQVSLNLVRTARTAANATDTSVSALFTLRNKP